MCCLGGISILCTPASADENLTDSPPADKNAAKIVRENDVITVSAPVKNPLFVTTSPKKTRQPVPASDGSDLLKTIPGFSQIRNGGSNGDPVFRGMFGSRLKIMADGTTLLGACGGRMDAATAYITPESYDLLKVIKGPQTVMWGPGASAGTLLFERRTENFSEPGWRGSAGQLFGSSSRYDTHIDTALGNELGYARLIGSVSRSADYKDGNNQPVPSKWHKWNTDVIFGMTPTADTLFEFTAGRSDGEARYAGRSMDGSQFLRENFSGKARFYHAGEYLQKTEIQYYRNDIDHIMDNYTLRSVPEGKKRHSNVGWQITGGRLLTHWQWSSVALKTGMDMQQSTHRKNIMRAGWSDDAKFTHYGIFAEMDWQMHHDGNVITGARIDNVGARDLRIRPAAEDTERKAIMKAGFVRYEHQFPALKTMFYTGLGYTERFPDYWELFSPKRGESGLDNAFSSIRPEKTTQLDAGIQYKSEQLDVWLSAYAGKINDFILFSYDKNTRITHAGNIDAHIMGAETGLMWRFSQRWKADTSLAYSFGENITQQRALPQMPPLEARSGLTYIHNDYWSASLLWRVVAKQKRIAPDQGNVVGKDFTYSPGFGVAALNTVFTINKNIQISAGIDNLFNKFYSEHLNLAGNSGFGYSSDAKISEPGRTLWTKIGITF